jgi:YHS domain-containing protein
MSAKEGHMQRLSSPWFAIVAALVLMAAWAFLAAAGEKTQEAVSEAPMAFEQAPEVGTKAMCPVSRQEFTVNEKTARSDYKGKHYVFCCPSCEPKFDKNPDKYLGAESQGGR